MTKTDIFYNYSIAVICPKLSPEDYSKMGLNTDKMGNVLVPEWKLTTAGEIRVN